MSWVSLLWAGLLAVVVPLWIFRQRRRGETVIPFSSIAILRAGTDGTPRRWKQIRSRLLWLRVAALLSLALALASVPPVAEWVPSRTSGLQSDSLREASLSFESGHESPTHWIAYSVSGEAERPLRTAFELMGDSLHIASLAVQAEDPTVWSRQRALSGEEAGQETFLIQGWPDGSSRTDQWLEWIRSGGHLVVVTGSEEDLIRLNRWLSENAMAVRAEPAGRDEQLSAEGLAQWFGDRLFARTVSRPQIHLPDARCLVEWSGDDAGDVLLRSRSGRPLVRRVGVGEGWLTLSGLSWEGGRSGWPYHPLFPFLLDALLRLPAVSFAAEGLEAMESGVDTLSTRLPEAAETPAERSESESRRGPEDRNWMIWVGLALGLFLTESVAGRYLSGLGSPPNG